MSQESQMKECFCLLHKITHESNEEIRSCPCIDLKKDKEDNYRIDLMVAEWDRFNVSDRKMKNIA